MMVSKSYRKYLGWKRKKKLRQGLVLQTLKGCHTEEARTCAASKGKTRTNGLVLQESGDKLAEAS